MTMPVVMGGLFAQTTFMISNSVSGSFLSLPIGIQPPFQAPAR
jgi:hypothetical protein